MSDDTNAIETLILTDDADGVRTITLNRPDARNAFDTALYTATGSALDAADADDAVRVVILAGAGKGFSAGQDLKEMAKIDPSTSGDAAADAGEHGFRTFIDAIEGFSKPLIAAVHGAAVGIGTTMLPYCDLVIVADDARLRLPFVPLGVVPEAGSSYTIPAILGRQLASYYLLTGDWLDGPGAVAAGLALRCVPRDELMAEAGALARRLAELSPASLAATKRLVRAGWLDAAQAARAREEAVFTTLLGHGASKDALDQFVGKGGGASTPAGKEAKGRPHERHHYDPQGFEPVLGGLMSWKVVVDYDVCESNAICMGIVPEVFEVRDDDFLYVLQDEPPDELREKVEQSVRQCPKQAISIVDE